MYCRSYDELFYRGTPLTTLDLLSINVLSPMVLAFIVGLVAVLARSDLSIPKELYTSLSIYLLLAIGLKGGHAMAQTPLVTMIKPVLATLAVGVIVPLLTFAIFRWFGRFGASDAAALAAHYGSVSAVTFAAAQSFLDTRGIAYEGFTTALMTILEVPAIVIALLLARVSADRDDRQGSWGVVLHEVLTGRSVVLLIGGMLIGYFSTGKNMERVTPVFINLFYGALVIFLLEMGTIAAKHLRDLKKAGWFLVLFAMVLPLVNGLIGVLLADWAQMSFGGTVMLGVMAASASYIAAPAAVRIALPDANPGYYVTASIGITFPFNLTIGIPVIFAMTRWLHG